MKIYGIDFTSSPSRTKPITRAQGHFKAKKVFFIEKVDTLCDFDAFEEFLNSPGSWIAGMDFPFGLPTEFLDKMKLPAVWSQYVRETTGWEKDKFQKKIRGFQKKAKTGFKEPRRITDCLSQAKSPLKLVNPPVGKMFFEGASRLLQSKVSVLPCLPRNGKRIAVEAYPALIARRIAKQYKPDAPSRISKDMVESRNNILKGLQSSELEYEFGFKVEFDDILLFQAIEDAKGDVLDAMLCSIQAAWAWQNRKRNYGIPGIDHPSVRSEGWIVDPELSIGSRSAKDPLSAFADLVQAGELESDYSVRKLISYIKKLSDIGRALSGEMNLPFLLEKIVTESRNLTNADGGTLYIVKGNKLHFKIVQNESLNIMMGGSSGVDISFPALEMNDTSVSAYVAMKGFSINIPDVYNYKSFDFTGPRKFDQSTGYRTKSMLVAPLRDYEGRTIGVLQILNARDVRDKNKIIPFSDDYVDLVESLASQAAVAISNADLISDLQKANSQLISARDQALEASRAKSTFLANMSHELRTPMNAIIGYSEMLMEDADGDGMAGFKDDLGKIYSSGKHLLKLINEVLDLSKIEAGKMSVHLQTFNVKEMVHEALIPIKPLAEKNNNILEFQCADDFGNMNADRIRVSQTLINLLSNACKFTENGTVILSVRRESIDQMDWILFVVTDTGIGIAPEERKKLFAEFSQIDSSSTRKFGGTGLGLTISLRFCRMMGGDIILQSTPGKGSTFTIKLPARVVPLALPLRRSSDRIRN